MGEASRQPSAIDKLTRLPNNAKVHKRPLLRPPIPSPYASKSHPKVVYISSRTPFMSGFQRVKQLLKHADKRTMQSALSNGKSSRKKGPKANIKTQEAAEPEEVLIKATGKAIDKALNLALFIQNQDLYDVKIRTSSVDAIDDIEMPPEIQSSLKEHSTNQDVAMSSGHAEVLDVPESRIRHSPMIEIAVQLK